MVALNYQHGDRSVWINQGKFAANCGCGFVPKPARFLLEPGAAAAAAVAVAPPGCRLRLTIISGHYLPKPRNEARGEIIDPFVVVDVAGAKRDRRSFRTRTVDDNGFDPEWRETFDFDISEPE